MTAQCRLSWAVLGIIALVVGGCRQEGAGETVRQPEVAAEASQNPTQGEESDMKLTSVFEPGERIDKRYTGEGEDRSPPLRWSNVPEGTESFALICDDPDAPSPRRPAATPWVHWVIYNIPASVTELPEGIERTAKPKEVPGALQGHNSWGEDSLGYRGPLPPPGSGTHRYFFKLYALDTKLDLPAGANKETLLKAMEGHVLAETSLVGTYER